MPLPLCATRLSLNSFGENKTMGTPQAARRFAREYYRCKVMYNGNHSTITYTGEWDTDNDLIIVTTILGDTFKVPVAASWL